ncbi:MAG: mechanosensitive ion channel protein MscS [Candidatus Omnitrophica bacterium CG11_big_fil_rev_8_21_14_0_20_42_13]|uniref:Mechanosensitive ion channel protein MscS n=1 Tax=Candidatus Ghiorseimicrobium undicola TaxID=1974746 RepID=A0A2H0LVL0_9BACT|nr:MAG: mechanosensitive ion channel protein MscS [Candidatus Omnitrophica bacterium CG11_big_fil_rev_8_21_14_0_20_42_13]
MDISALKSILDYQFLGNSVLAYLIFLATFIVSVIVLHIIKNIVIAKIKKITEKTKNSLDDFILGLCEKIIMPLLYFGAFYFSISQLSMADALKHFLSSLFIIVMASVIARLASAIVIFFLKNTWLKDQFATASGAGKSVTLFNIVRLVFWGAALVFILDNLGFNIAAVIAGLGIGGVAVALAAQTILGDLFNYFVIFFDKPFEEGDFIITGEFMGVIENIGIKTTRVRSLGGEQLVFSNSDLASSRIRNYKRMEKRRVLFLLGVTYQTSLQQLKKIPGIIKDIVANVKDTVFDRAHFKEYGDFNLVIEIVYFVLSSDYNKYMDIQQEINFAIKEAFEKESIEFAYPTQTLFVEKANI